MSAAARHAAERPDNGLFRVVFGLRDSSGVVIHEGILLETPLLEEAMDCFAGAKFDLASYWSTGRHVDGDEKMARLVFFARLEKGAAIVDEASYGRNEYVRSAGIRPAIAHRTVRP